jgi:hypothetical protein
MKNMGVKRSIYLALMGFMLFSFSVASNAQTKEELEKRRREIQQEIASLQKAQSDISKIAGKKIEKSIRCN